MINVLISMCMCGINCRYDGKSISLNQLSELSNRFNLIPVCPEIIGGLSTPRAPVEITNNKLIDSNGNDKTDNFISGANQVLQLAKMFNCEYAILKENSPSCGVNYIYDGTFTSNKIKGSGITTSLLRENGIKVYSETEIDTFINDVLSKSTNERKSKI